MGQGGAEPSGWRLFLAGLGWAALTLTLLLLLGVGLPVLLAASLVDAFPRAGQIAVATAALITAGTAILLGRETVHRSADRPSLRKALLLGFGFALCVGVPGLLLWFGYWLVASSS